ncbi:MAG: hypothetical protein WC894_03260 [Patescibacteria group bacterium]
MIDSAGATEGAKPAQLFKTYDVPVQDGKIVRKGATGIVGNTTVSIQPNGDGVDDLEVAFLRKDKKGKDKFVGEPMRINATQEDVEEVADTLTRHLAGGKKAEDLIKLLEEKNEADTTEMLEYWRGQLKKGT